MTKVAKTRERGIIFSGPMVLAIIDGRKTQTRRILNPQPGPTAKVWLDENTGEFIVTRQSPHVRMRCPYGVAGDRLWVREAWAIDCATVEQAKREYEDAMCGILGHGPYYRATEVAPHTLRWRPSILMPRWASRIVLEIVSLRAERLQKITEADVDAEGFGGDYPHRAFPEIGWSQAAREGAKSMPECFGEAWDTINGDRAPWASNPWVWVLEFRRVT